MAVHSLIWQNENFIYFCIESAVFRRRLPHTSYWRDQNSTNISVWNEMHEINANVQLSTNFIHKLYEHSFFNFSFEMIISTHFNSKLNISIPPLFFEFIFIFYQNSYISYIKSEWASFAICRPCEHKYWISYANNLPKQRTKVMWRLSPFVCRISQFMCLVCYVCCAPVITLLFTAKPHLFCWYGMWLPAKLNGLIHWTFVWRTDTKITHRRLSLFSRHLRSIHLFIYNN